MEQKPEKEPARNPSFDTIEGTLERFTFRNAESGFAVVRLAPDDGSGRVSCVGQLSQLAEGQKLRVVGRRVEHPRFGPQLEVDHVEAIVPSSVDGIRAYLASSLVKGVGPAFAERITDRFGADTLRIIEEEPERLREVPGLGEKRIRELQSAVQAQKDVQEVMVFLRAHGLGQALATRIVKRYGKGASALIQANPYRLADDVIGIGFRTADRLAGEIGITPTAPDRIQAGTLYQLGVAARNGHCFLPRDELTQTTAELLELEPAVTDAQIPALALQGRVRLEPLVGVDAHPREAVFPTTLHLAETGVGEGLRALVRQPSRPLKIDVPSSLAAYEVQSGMTLPPGQRAAVQRALTAAVSVITGGPGVGKTTIIRALSDILRRHDRRLVLCAPTGRAAKRLEESTGQEARTIHRLLDWNVGSNRFLRDDTQPLEGDVLVVDEASMLDVQLAYNLVRAIPPHMALVLCGDVDQLPSVGPGQVLADLIASELVPVTRLTEIFRQHGESLIVKNAHALLRGETPTSAPDDAGDFFCIESRDNQHTRELVLELVTRRIPRRFGLDPIRDVQVLTPMYRGHAGADTINADLQERLNPGDKQITRGNRILRVGDKVMQVRNDYDLDLFNGDTGRVRAIDTQGSVLMVEFGARLIEYPFGELDALVTAYAITVHRAQGSEYPAVVVPLATDHYMMLRRNLLYTAITRGRKLVVLVGVPKALQMAVRNDQEAHRYSALADRLRGA